MVARLCLPMSYPQLDSNQTAETKPDFAGVVCRSSDAVMP